MGRYIVIGQSTEKLSLSDDAIKHLKRKGLIEGRKPHIHVSAKVAKATASKAEYIKMRAQDDEHYIKLVTDFIKKFSKAGNTKFYKN